ncbi:hypothetical protein Tco_0542478, partial [Tanacetum coccineum]
MRIQKSHLENLGASCTQGTVSSIPIAGSISLEGFLSLILLLVVIIATVVVVVAIIGVVIVVAVIGVVVVVVGVPSISELSFWFLVQSCVSLSALLTFGLR